MTRKIPPKILRNPISPLRWLFWQVARYVRKTFTVSTRQGRFTIFSADHGIGKSLFCYGEYEMDWVGQVVEFLRLKKHLPADSTGTVLDIGANLGVISIGVIHAGLMEKAIAIEPDPANFSLLVKNVSLNHLDHRFVCLRYAASNGDGSLKFELSTDNYGDHRIHHDSNSPSKDEHYRESGRIVTEVPAGRLDGLLERVDASYVDDIAIVWIDVQGYEGFVFQGGEQFFARKIPVAPSWPNGIRRARGMNADQFCAIVEKIWSYYWVIENEEFVRYPISDLGSLFADLDSSLYTNVILMHD